jgi:glucoamylase
VWFTLWRGILTEVYYPTVDRPQLHDLEFLFTDGESFFARERELACEIESIDNTLAYRIRIEDRERGFKLTKEILSEPLRPTVLIHCKLDSAAGKKLKLFFACHPHLEVGGEGNCGYATNVAGTPVLIAEKGGRWLAVSGNCRFARMTCGFYGRSDIRTDLSENCRMDWEFDRAENGNVVLGAEIDIGERSEFKIGMSFGEDRSSAISNVLQSLGVPFECTLGRFRSQWKDTAKDIDDLARYSHDGGRVLRTSYNVILAHEDKTYQGAFIASLAIPWGEARTDKDGGGGYHLVWTRDLVQSAMGVLAAGNKELALRALIYTAARQQPNGRFPQNFWIDGRPYWHGLQLDEVAFPVILAHRLDRLAALQDFNPRVMVKRAVGYLLSQGPVTGQDRWEEHGGYSPASLAAVITALISAASFSREDGDIVAAELLESYADFLREGLFEWTVANETALDPKIGRHFIRLNPAKPGEVAEPGSADHAMLELPRRPPGQPGSYPARDIIDAGFLQLPRYGILDPNDPLITETLRLIDAHLKVETPHGFCWRRYPHDSYGQKPDGGPFADWGQGRAWPLLAGERGHYELSLGRDPQPYTRSMEGLASRTGLIPEQVWDAADLPQRDLYCGRATGSAMPLVWAHAEYIRLLRSTRDRRVFDLIDEVEDRYVRHRPPAVLFEFWTCMHPIRRIRKGRTLRICSQRPFRVRWTDNEWSGQHDTDSVATALDLNFADIPTAPDQRAPVEFTFFWLDQNAWEGRNYRVEIRG